MLQIGDSAPGFVLQDHTGADISLDALLTTGDLILYFYPADFTPVCTAEACMFRDSFDELAEIDVQVVGVSPQDSASHARFAERFELPFTLLCDQDKTLIRAYGVDGPLGFGVRRVTFLIDSSGVIRNRVVADVFLGQHGKLLRSTLER